MQVFTKYSYCSKIIFRTIVQLRVKIVWPKFSHVSVHIILFLLANIAGCKTQLVDWWFNSTKQLRTVFPCLVVRQMKFWSDTFDPQVTYCWNLIEFNRIEEILKDRNKNVTSEIYLKLCFALTGFYFFPRKTSTLLRKSGA